MTDQPEGEEYVAYERYQASVRAYKKRMRAYEIRHRIKNFLVKAASIAGVIVLTSWLVFAYAASPTQPRSWTTETYLRHVMALPNCAAARAVGLAPAYRGLPGYWKHLDRDQDGIACEVWPRR